MDPAQAEHWSEIAESWEQLWGGFSAPARAAIIAGIPIRAGARVLDVGCGTGEFVADTSALGASGSGIDPAAAMVRIARGRVPGADIRIGDAEHLPWADHAFDVVTAVNALQFAEDTLDALAEFARVTVPGGHIAVANWAERSRNDLDVLEQAVATANGEQMLPDGELQRAGGLKQLLTDAGFEVVHAGVVATPWEVRDETALTRGVLMGEDAATMERLRPAIIEAARPFALPDGGYRLRNAFRYVIARRR